LGAQPQAPLDYGGGSIFVTNPAQRQQQTSFWSNKSDALNARVRDMRAIDAPLFQSTWTNEEVYEWAALFLDAEDVNKLRRMFHSLCYYVIVMFFLYPYFMSLIV
jgi:hypothetical protein